MSIVNLRPISVSKWDVYRRFVKPATSNTIQICANVADSAAQSIE